jgi:serine/threonine protein kinase
MSERDPDAEYEYYRILRQPDGNLWELGHGAMGITYKALDTNLRALVALKIISPLYFDDENAREFFLAEARAAASLRHRNVAAIHHLGSDARGFFYVMEFIDGETADALVRRLGRLDVPLALHIVQQVAFALAAAARHGIVHRDLKPANLMLVNEGDGDLVVKVIDFGLAKSLAPAGETEPGRVVRMAAGTGPFLGTPHFASPEQIRDDPALDGRADIYSLGARLWHLLAGRPPFADSPLAQVRARHLHEPPPFDQLPTDLPAAVYALLGRMLEKDPAARPQTPAELIALIEAAGSVVRPPDLLAVHGWKTRGCLPLVGMVLAGNYHLEALVAEGVSGPLFRAEDLAAHRTAAIRLLDADPRTLAGMEQAVYRLERAPHPNLLETFSLTSCRGQSFLVLEWIEGFPLAALLRARRALPLTEALPLLRQVAEAVDHARVHDLGELDFLPRHILAHFPGGLGNTSHSDLFRRPLTTWPAWTLKLRAHPVVPGSAERRILPAHQISGIDDGPSGADDLVRGLAQLAAELLGGAPARTERAPTQSVPDARDGIPQAISRAFALEPGYLSAREFVETLAQASEGEAALHAQRDV